MARARQASLRHGPESQQDRPRRVLAVVPANCRFEHMAVNQRLRALLNLAQVDILACYPESFPPDISGTAHIRGPVLSSWVSNAQARMLCFSVEASVRAAAERLLRRYYPIIYTFQDTSAFAGRLLRRSGARWIVDVLDAPSLELRNAEQQGRRRKAAALLVRDWLIGRMFRNADLVVTIGSSISDPLPEILRKRYRVDPGRVLPLRQAIRMAGISPQPCAPARGCRTIFYVGWVSALRGIDTLIKATDLLREYGIPAELRLAGELKRGDAGLRAMIERRQYVSYLGVLPSTVVRDEILNAGICCCPFPDREELACVQPVKVLEFLALGRPVVGSRTSGMAAIIEHERSGILAIPGSPESFADAFARIFDDRELAARLSSGARIRASLFDAGEVGNQLQERLKEWI